MEVSRNQLTIFTQIPNTAESFQKYVNPYLIRELSVTTNKPLMIFTGADPEYSVEGYLKLSHPT